MSDTRHAVYLTFFLDVLVVYHVQFCDTMSDTLFATQPTFLINSPFTKYTDYVADSDISSGSHSSIPSISPDSCSVSSISIDSGNIKIESSNNSNVMEMTQNSNVINSTNAIISNVACTQSDLSKGMPDSPRIFMKATLKAMTMGLNTAGNQLIEDDWLKLWCQNKLRTSMDKLGNLVLQKLIVKIQGQYINLLVVYTDENINHFEHVFSCLFNDPQQRWNDNSWWWNYYTRIWIKFNNITKINRNKLEDLPKNKSHIFVKNINKVQVWQVIYVWIKNQNLDEILLKLTNNAIQLKCVKISPTLIVFLYELTCTLHEKNLVSQNAHTTKKTRTKKSTIYYTSRQLDLHDDVHDWMQDAYENKDGLIYLLIFDAWNEETNQINPKLKNGITDNMDPKISLSQWSTDPEIQLYLLHSLSYMVMKYLIFYRLLNVGLEGAFWWTTETFHSPLKDIYYTMKKIWYAHYYHIAATKKYIEPQKANKNYKRTTFNKSSNSNNNNQEYQIQATGEQRNEWKTSQCEVTWFKGFSYQEISADSIIQPTMSFKDDSNLWTLPLSCGWGLFSHATLKGLQAAGNHIWKGGKTVDDKTAWKSAQATWNSKRILTIKELTIAEIEQEICEIKQKIANTMSNVNCKWSTYDPMSNLAFRTNKSKEYCQHKFAKHKDIHGSDWSKVSTSKAAVPVYHDGKFYGFDLKQRSKCQMKNIQSIEYATCAQFLKDEGYIVMDSGAEMIGNQWYGDTDLKENGERTIDGIVKTKAEIDNNSVDINKDFEPIFHEKKLKQKSTNKQANKSASNCPNQLISPTTLAFLENENDCRVTTNESTLNQWDEEDFDYDSTNNNNNSNCNSNTNNSNSNGNNNTNYTNTKSNPKRQSWIKVPNQNAYLQNQQQIFPLLKNKQNTCNIMSQVRSARKQIPRANSRNNNNQKNNNKNNGKNKDKKTHSKKNATVMKTNFNNRSQKQRNGTKRNSKMQNISTPDSKRRRTIKSSKLQQYNDFDNGNNTVIDDADDPIETICDDEDSQENLFYSQQDVIDLIDD